MKKLLFTVLSVGLLTGTVYAQDKSGSLSKRDIHNIQQHPHTEARKTALRHALERKGIKADKETIRETLHNFHKTYGTEIKNSHRSFEEVYGRNVDDNGNARNDHLNKGPKYLDDRLKPFNRNDWKIIKQHPKDSTARQTAIQVLMKSRTGKDIDHMSAAELLGAFIADETKFKVIAKQKAEAEAKAKAEAEAKAKSEKDKKENKSESKDTEKVISKTEESKIIKSGWKSE